MRSGTARACPAEVAGASPPGPPARSRQPASPSARQPGCQRATEGARWRVHDLTIGVALTTPIVRSPQPPELPPVSTLRMCPARGHRDHTSHVGHRRELLPLRQYVCHAKLLPKGPSGLRAWRARRARTREAAMGGEGTDPVGGHEHREPDVNGETRDQGTHGGPGPTGAHAERAEAGGGAGGERTAGQADLLGEMKALRRQARAARHAYWFPLVLFGVLTCASVPFYTVPGYRRPGRIRPGRAPAPHARRIPWLHGAPLPGVLLAGRAAGRPVC